MRLDLQSLERKIVREGRGGYCFEQNLLFSHELQTLGSQVTGPALPEVPELDSALERLIANTPRV